MNSLRFLYLALLGIIAGLLGGEGLYDLSGFLLPSIFMGIGVGIDVFIATIVKYRDRSLSWKSWTIPVVITHISFPAFGYFLFWSLSTSLPIAKIVLGITGFVLVSLFTYEVLCESTGIKPKFGISAWISGLLNLKEKDSRTFITVLVVSWDALWSGPAKAAQASVGGWSNTEVVLSFLVAGAVVAIVAELALFLAFFLRKREFKNPISLSRYNIIGKYLELSVIGGFGVLSLWQSFSDNANLYLSMIVSGTIIAIIFFKLHTSLWKSQLKESRTAVSQKC
ncbi:MAG TPA: hypothetical protein PKD95_02230 [Candidatus Paceibacterota bacterium]|nr:hypothetical protein [Candidatus Paceibacterota bacterium]